MPSAPQVADLAMIDDELANQGPSQFYGAIDKIRRDQRRFLAYFSGATSALDLGCGDGMFMELLRERGIHATGVDLSQSAVDRCRRRGLTDVLCEDALVYLRSTERQFDGIFAAHLIEHLAPNVAVEFLRLCRERLLPGGRLVLLTPNPADLSVISEVFWLDLTHVRPYPLQLLEVMLRQAGFRVAAGGHYQSTGLGRRQLPRRLLLRLILGKHYEGQNTFVVGEAPRH